MAVNSKISLRKFSAYCNFQNNIPTYTVHVKIPDIEDRTKETHTHTILKTKHSITSVSKVKVDSCLHQLMFTRSMDERKRSCRNPKTYAEC